MGLYVGRLIDPRAAARAVHAAAPLRGDVGQPNLSLVLERGPSATPALVLAPPKISCANQSIRIAITFTIQIQKRTTASSSDALDFETQKCASVCNPPADVRPYV